MRVVVVPCFNEAARLDPARVATLVDSDTRVLFVDDGSSDATPHLLAAARRAHEGIDVLVLPHNVGKGEAVRAGFLWALREGADIVASLDADLSTPPDELLRLLRLLDETPHLDVVTGARVARLGATIERSAARHYLGRLFATAASWGLALPVYDTQCGAKVFRVTPALRRALATPFRSRWAFDVELLGRLLDELSPSRFLEVPLRSWRDVRGSKLSPLAALRAGVDVVGIAVARRLRR